MRVLKMTTIGFFGLALLLLIAAGLIVSTTFPKRSGTIELSDLSAAVKVYRDSSAVPHIYASTDDDGYFALGFIHAQDRFWQMEMMRRFGAGRLSEILGNATVSTDKWMRTLGLYRLAEQEISVLPVKVQSALAAYARGVNQWLESKAGLGAIEFAAFRYTPYPWRSADSLVWTKIMATRLAGNFRKEFLRSRVTKAIGANRMNELWPDYPGQTPSPTKGESRLETSDFFAGLDAMSPRSPGLPTGASNQWVVGPEISKSKAPLLANDPHLGFSAPIMWYLAHIETPNLKLTGATVPGVPFHLLGHNGKIAWGITSTQADQEDLVVEKTVMGDQKRYVTTSGPKPFTHRAETIRVKDHADQVIAVRASQNGPILSDLRPDLIAGDLVDHLVALNAVYLKSDDQTLNALYLLNRADNWLDFQSALKFVKSPALNLAYADTIGNIGFQVAGALPVRRSGDGSMPTQGWTGASGWQSYVDFSQLPSRYNPASNLIVNANDPVGDVTSLPFVSRDWAAPYRASRINHVLAANLQLEMKDMASLQLDEVSLAARDLLAAMIPLTDTEPAKNRDVLGLMKNWDGYMGKNRPEPLIFSFWLRQLNRALYADDLGRLSQNMLALRPRFVKTALIEKPDWCDNVNTEGIETCSEIVSESLNKAIINLSKQFGPDMKAWQWGDVHTATFAHSIFKHIPYLNRLTDLTIANGGSDFTVNRGASHVNNDQAPFKHIHGPGYRGVYDLSDLSKSKFMIATGQSGNFLSGHYRDLLTRWRDGSYMTIDGSLEALRSDDHLILKPARN